MILITSGGLGSHSSPFSFFIFCIYSFFSCVWHFLIAHRAGVLTNTQCHSFLSSNVWSDTSCPCQPRGMGAIGLRAQGAAATPIQIPPGAHTCPPTPRASSRVVAPETFLPAHPAPAAPLPPACPMLTHADGGGSLPVPTCQPFPSHTCAPAWPFPPGGLTLHPMHGHLYDSVWDRSCAVCFLGEQHHTSHAYRVCFHTLAFSRFS